MGPSGSGKSSFLHLLSLLDKPTTGKIYFLGKDSKNFSENQKDEIRRRNISLIFQDNNLLSDFTTIENVLMPLIIRGESYKSSHNKAKNILKRVNLLERRNHFPSELSGGEQQRLALARALATDPEVLFLDEPTANLDPAATAVIEAAVERIRDAGTKAIFVTHDIGQARRLADDIVFMHRGRICETGPAVTFFDTPRTREAQQFLQGELVL